MVEDTAEDTAEVAMNFDVETELWERARKIARRSRGVYLKEIVARAIRRRLLEWRNQELVIEDPFEGKRRKPHLEPFPGRGSAELRSGYPVGGDARDGATISTVKVLLPVDLRERWYDAIYWLGSYKSHETSEALRDYLDSL